MQVPYNTMGLTIGAGTAFSLEAPKVYLWFLVVFMLLNL
jgi:hypothetical protein